MSKFLTLPTIYPFKAVDTGTWCWAISDPLHWQDDNGEIFIVPSGFYTDLGSIPWFARFLFNPGDPQCARSYMLHDWFLTLGLFKKRIAAYKFNSAMKADAVPKLSRYTQFFAVWLASFK